MTLIEGFNPFRPGDGQRPPYLAGRENKQGRLRQIMAEMSAGGPPAANIVMYGPRGMGKTALLNWVGDEVENTAKDNLSLRTVQAAPTIFPSLKSLWNKLISDDWKQKLWPEQVQLGAAGNKIMWNLKAPDDDDLVSALIEECKERPLVLLMDEAHTMEPTFCQALLNISQQARQKAPFLLVLAGTPGLPHFLSSVNATFAERSAEIGIGRLDTEAAGAAIEKPLNEHGIKIDADALSRVVEDSQCYPYFIQQWGQSLWNEADKANLTSLTDGQVDIAEPNVNGTKQSLYAKRCSRLFQDELLPVAQIIAEAFRDTPKYTEIDLAVLIKGVLPADKADDRHTASILQALARQDFVWRPPGTDLYEPGVPSLMTYVLDQQREAG